MNDEKIDITNDTVKILKLTEERINELSDEKVIYQGERQYFGAGRIKNKNISFVFTYSKKTNELGFQAEASDMDGIFLLKKVFNENIDFIEREVGFSFNLTQGSKNESWHRLRSTIFIDESRSLVKQIDELVIGFITFKTVLASLVENIIIKNKETNILKEKSRSWIYVTDNEDSNFLARKSTDYSIFNRGTTIAQRYHSVFLNNISEEVKKGEQVKIKIKINNVKYNGIIRWPASKDRKGVTIQLLYTDKNLIELLRDKLSVSYDYIIKFINENGKKPSSIPEEFEEYIDFYKGEELDEFIIKLIPKGTTSTIEYDDLDSESEDVEIDEIGQEELDFREILNIVDEVEHIHKYISSKGFDYSIDLIKNFYLSLKTKPFVILSGISGTGKSKLVELFAEAIGATYNNERFKLIPVKPEWSDSTDLLGYRNIEGKFTPGIITSVAYEAMKNPEVPYFICLDEMNLARVEYYFSDILSLMETRRSDDGNIVTEKLLSREQFGRDERAFDKYGDVYIPQNMYIVGTVNMDETTFPFSKKVLDRANTIEFNKVNLEYNFDDVVFEKVERRCYKNNFLASSYLKLAQCKVERVIATKVIEILVSINTILEEYNQHFGYRVRDEIVFYMIYATNDKLMDFDDGLDYCIVQKILPKINGSNGDVLEILVKIYNFLNETSYDYSYVEDSQLREMTNKAKGSKYKNSSEKLVYMIRRFVRDGFTTFWQ